MAHFFEDKARHVIPNWRSFENTARLGELNGSRDNQFSSTFKPDITDLLKAWDEADQLSMGLAGDVIGGLTVANQLDLPIAEEIAQFVITNKEFAPRYLLEVADEILNPRNKTIVSLDFESLESFQEHGDRYLIFNKINALKSKLRANPSNAINWIEIGRLYAILGQDEKAQRSVKNALFLAPENRFILRGMSRFFVHTGEEGLNFAHDFIKGSQLVKHDSWVLATEISLATLRERSSNNTKLGLQIVTSSSLHPFNTSELSSALATLELKNDKIKSSKKLFQQSLIKPNDNSVAQAEWASLQSTSLTGINPSQSTMANSYEALARDFADKSEWEKSIEYSKKWFLDLPFSKSSILFGNHIALRKMKNHEIAIEVAKLGLLSHPNDTSLLNNIVYSLCILNRLNEAGIYLGKVRKEDWTSGTVQNACLLATLGLYQYRLNNFDLARQYYNDAMSLAKSLGNDDLMYRALVNMAREEIAAKSTLASNLTDTLKQVREKTNDSTVVEDINGILKVKGNFHFNDGIAKK